MKGPIPKQALYQAELRPAQQNLCGFRAIAKAREGPETGPLRTAWTVRGPHDDLSSYLLLYDEYFRV